VERGTGGEDAIDSAAQPSGDWQEHSFEVDAMYLTGQVGASDLCDLETRMIHRMDQLDAKWQHALYALESRLDSQRRFVESILMTSWLAAMFVVNVLIWVPVLRSL
jgi:hypothetical protein